MPRLTITRLRDLVRSLRYTLTGHATEELDNDNFTILDLETIILAGEIIERQKDRVTGEIKCVVRGGARDGAPAEVVVKIDPTGRLVVITIYRC